MIAGRDVCRTNAGSAGVPPALRPEGTLAGSAGIPPAPRATPASRPGLKPWATLCRPFGTKDGKKKRDSDHGRWNHPPRHIVRARYRGRRSGPAQGQVSPRRLRDRLGSPPLSRSPAFASGWLRRRHSLALACFKSAKVRLEHSTSRTDAAARLSAASPSKAPRRDAKAPGRGASPIRPAAKAADATRARRSWLPMRRYRPPSDDERVCRPSSRSYGQNHTKTDVVVEVLGFVPVAVRATDVCGP